jgi:hypothetical protein
MLKCDPRKYVELGEIILLGFVCQVTFFSCAIQLKFFSVDKFGFEYSLGLGLGSDGIVWHGQCWWVFLSDGGLSNNKSEDWFFKEMVVDEGF